MEIKYLVSELIVHLEGICVREVLEMLTYVSYLVG